jgi:hypothetical protein
MAVSFLDGNNKTRKAYLNGKRVSGWLNGVKVLSRDDSAEVPYAWYKFAGDINDYSGNNRHLTGAAQFVDDAVKGTVLSCGSYWWEGNQTNGWKDFLKTPFNIDPTWTHFKIAWKAFINESQNYYACMFECGGNYGGGAIKCEKDTPYNGGWGYAGDSSIGGLHVFDDLVVGDAWNEIEFEFSPTGLAVTCNGARREWLVNTINYAANFPYYPMRIGAGTAGVGMRWFQGKIMDFKIYKY